MAEAGRGVCWDVAGGDPGMTAHLLTSTYPAVFLLSQIHYSYSRKIAFVMLTSANVFVGNHMSSLLWQHGRGTHVWILRRVDGSQYSQSNRYTGDFVQGQRHGQGTFFYAGGATYEGEWKNNKKHGEVDQSYSIATHCQYACFQIQQNTLTLICPYSVKYVW